MYQVIIYGLGVGRVLVQSKSEFIGKGLELVQGQMLEQDSDLIVG